MPLSIKDPEADRLVREVARLTGETITQAVVTSLPFPSWTNEPRTRSLATTSSGFRSDH